MRLNKEDIADLDFDKGMGLIPCIVQDSVSSTVLMLGYVNAGALMQSFDTGKMTFYSRSKDRLWTKGETSGNFLEVDEIYYDCDNDSILAKVNPKGPVCHTGQNNCFGTSEETSSSFLGYLEGIISDRRENPSDSSYTSGLFKKGINSIAQKVGEEAVELVIEAKDDNDELFINEAADLLYHYMILLEAKGYHMKDVEKILAERHKK